MTTEPAAAGSRPAPARIRPAARLTLAGARALSGLSRRVGMGSGSVIGGQMAVFVHRRLLSQLTDGRAVALVSGTNGKSTTNHFLARGLATEAPVATNADGANMDAGMVVALGAAPDAPYASLECDELWLPQVLRQTGPAVVVLLNLSRDQLDRTQEVRSIAESWRAALADLPVTAVVANADDPLVVWAALGAAERTSTDGTPARLVWVGTGAWWTLDATGCPACGGRITFGRTASEETSSWACEECGFSRPEPEVALVGDGVRLPDGQVVHLSLRLPGRANRANAAMATATATVMGADPRRVIASLADVDNVAGRYGLATVDGHPVRLLLAKNPAGWQEALEMVDGATAPAVVAINARIADGRDPSWLWDVPFERLRGRYVVASGERRHDLAVRLSYADVDHGIARNLHEAMQLVADHVGRHADGGPAATGTPTVVDVIGNYTAVQDHLEEVDEEADDEGGGGSS